MMRMSLFFFALLTIASPSLQNANACGDKFLVIGRGLRYERVYAAQHPGSILIYNDRNLVDPKASSDLENVLKKAGHKVQAVENVNAMNEALKSSKFDLVVIDLNDVAALEPQIVASPSNPAVLPVIYNRTGSEVSSAEKQYDCILKASGKNNDALKVVDAAMAEKLSGAPIKCKWSK
jgi:hypothetical protein